VALACATVSDGAITKRDYVRPGTSEIRHGGTDLVQDRDRTVLKNVWANALCPAGKC